MKWRLGHMQDIKGSAHVMVPLNSDQNYSQSYYSKSTHSTRNYLFIDTRSNQQRWFFQTNQYLIVNTSQLSRTDDKDKDTLAILYTVIKKDTNGDQRLTDADEAVIALSTPSGQGYKEILQGVDTLLGYRVIDQDTMLILYKKQGAGYSAYVGLKDFVLSQESQWPKIKHGS